jgi:hypothetical protein
MGWEPVMEKSFKLKSNTGAVSHLALKFKRKIVAR